MAQTQQKPNTADFLGNLVNSIAERRELVRTQYLELDARRHEGIALMENLTRHIEALGKLPANSENLPVYSDWIGEAKDRKEKLELELVKLGETLYTLQIEFSALNSLRGEN
jgi:hypothetical protein